MKFQDFEFRTNDEHIFNQKIISYRNLAGKECPIAVKTYLPVSDKIDLVAIALQKAEENGVYNEFLLDVYFHLNIIYLYTDIEFELEDRQDELKLFDILETNGIIDEVVGVLSEGEDGGEYKQLKDTLLSMEVDILTYKNTAAAVLQKIVTDLPANAAAAKEIVDSFNPEQYQQVIDFATAANGGRNINTQMDALAPAAEQKKEEKPIPQRKIVSIQSATKKD